MSTPDLRTAAEAAARLGVTHVTIIRWAADGQIQPVRDKPLLFNGAEIDRKADELITELQAKLDYLISRKQEAAA